MSQPRKRVHLICNAHIDPVWLWRWEDGVTTAISTFRVAADFCEKEPGFVFNHNEALLYRWIERYEPTLFQRILRLVKKGSWHVSGGAFLQPDVNNPGGECHIRQFLLGLEYFQKGMGVRPRVAYNFDPFGHPEGFAQILVGCGMEGYIFCRPDYGTHPLPIGAFHWKDRSGVRILTRRSDDQYISRDGLPKKLDQWLPHFLAHEPETMILWGIGNHGGGPAKQDFVDLRQYIEAHPDYDLVHSTPEAFFDSLKTRSDNLPTVTGEIENSFAGCYTSMSRVKRAYRLAENLLLAVERLITLNWWAGRCKYPLQELNDLWRELLFATFHDILPGSAIPSAEQDSLQLIALLQEKLRRLRLTHSLMLLRDQAPAKPLETPVFIFNPHGFAVHTTVEFEYVPSDQYHDANRPVELVHRHKVIDSQALASENNLFDRWCIRQAVPVRLRPFEVLRLDSRFNGPPAPHAPRPTLPVTRESLTFDLGEFTLAINPRTGLINEARLRGDRQPLLKNGALRPVLFPDLDHSWTCGDRRHAPTCNIWSQAIPFRKPSVVFKLATPEQAAELSPLATDRWKLGRRTAARALRVVEHGPVLTVVEAMFTAGPSSLIRHYVLDHVNQTITVHDRVYYLHKDHMLKLELPLGFTAQRSISEAPYSAVMRQPTKLHEERTQQRWTAVQREDGAALAIVSTGIFAHSLKPRMLALNLMRSPAYASFNIRPGDPYFDQRFRPRQDQGEHTLSYQLLFQRGWDEPSVSRASQVLNAPPYAVVYFPEGSTSDAAGTMARPLSDVISVNPGNVQITVLKRAQLQDALIVRLQEQSGRATRFQVKLEGSVVYRGEIGAYRLMTLAIEKNNRDYQVQEVNLVEGL